MKQPMYLLLDSGAVTIYHKLVIKKAGRGRMGQTFAQRKSENHDYIKTEDYITFRNCYAEFLKNNPQITNYINLDVINNSEESYENLKWLESKGLKPIPVFHLGADVSWLKRYVNEKYPFVCMGGITPNPFKVVKPLLDKIWRDILTDRNGMPKIKVHGLAVASFNTMVRYPWWSVDSSSAVKKAAFGGVFIPKLQRGHFNFLVNPIKLNCSNESPSAKHRSHLKNVSKKETELVHKWLEFIGFKPDDKETIYNSYYKRYLANVHYFYNLSQAMPKWPWAFHTEKERCRLL